MGEEEEETEVVVEEFEEAGGELEEVKCEVRGPDLVQTRGGLLTTTGEMIGRPSLGTVEVAEEAAAEDGAVVEEAVELEVVGEGLTTETETRREQKTLSEK